MKTCIFITSQATTALFLILGTTFIAFDAVPVRANPNIHRSAATRGRSAGHVRTVNMESTRAVYIVTSTADGGPGSLRWAISSARAGDSVEFSPALTGKKISLTSGQIVIDKDITITGPGSSLLTISGQGTSRIFFVRGGVVKLSGLTIADGFAKGGDGGSGNAGGGGAAGMGGGLFINNGYVTLTDVGFTGNRALGGNGGDPTSEGSRAGGGGGGVAFGGNGVGSTASAADTYPAAIGGNGGSGGVLGGAGGSSAAFNSNSGGDGAGGAGGSVGPTGDLAINGGAGGFGGGGGGAGSALADSSNANSNSGGGNGGNGSGPFASVLGGIGGAGGFGGGGGGAGLSGGNPGAGGTFGGDGQPGTGPAPSVGGGGAGLGGAIFVRGGSLIIVSGTFSGNAATPGNLNAPGATPGQGKGGAVFLNAGVTGNIAMDDVTFSGNSATDAGSTSSDNANIFGSLACGTTKKPVISVPASVKANSSGNNASGPGGAGSYSWTISGGTITKGASTQTVTFSAGSSGKVTLNLTLTDSSGCHASNAVDVAVQAIPADGAPLPPTLSKAFLPSTIPVGTTTSLVFTITNPSSDSTLTGVGFTDVLPAGITVGSSTGDACGGRGGSITTVAPNTITVSDVSLPFSGSCEVDVTVTGTVAGAHDNTTGPITSTEGGTGTTSNTATLVVLSSATIMKAFGSGNVPVGQTTTLTFTLTNPNPTTDITGASFTDAFPAGLVVANPANVSDTCGGTFSPNPGDTSLTYIGGTIPAASSCTVSLNVEVTTPGTKTNVASGVSSDNAGTGAPSNPAVTGSFDKCLKDDHSGNFVQFSSTTGDYMFTICGPSGFTLSGTGTVRIVNSLVYITDSKADRRVTIQFNTATLTGRATLTKILSSGAFLNYSISDTNPNPVCACNM